MTGEQRPEGAGADHGGRRLRVLVVDDELPARRHVARLVAADARFRAIGEARDGLQALAQIEALAPEVLILDIQMPGLNGFELLEALTPPIPFSVLFSTASDAHALRAFDAHAVDYLLKPYTDDRFARALDKVYAQRIGATWSVNYQAMLRHARPLSAPLILKTVEGPWVKLRCDEVTRVSAANKHVRVTTAAGSYVVRQQLRELASRLDERFVRVHRSDIVNVDAVLRFETWEHGDGLLVLHDGTSLVLTRTFRANFLAKFGARGKSDPSPRSSG